MITDMYYIKTPELLQKTMPQALWQVKDAGQVLYLTFDDGPIPEVTPWVLEQLAEYDAKATFFCVGANVERHPAIYQQLFAAGHTVGNHTFNHYSGWSTANGKYYDNIAKCATFVNSSFFRPPYGQISPIQYRHLKKSYTIVMWDILAGDFDKRLDGQQCADNVIDNAENGSIVVLHDSLKAKDRLLVALPLILKHFHQKGYQFHSLPVSFTN